MKKFITFIYYLLYVSGIFILWIIPVNKYEWMQEMDETLKKLPEDSSGDIGVVITTLVGILIALSLVRFMFTKGWMEKVILIALTVLAIALWIVK